MSIFSGPDIITDGLVLYLDAANSRSYPGTGTTWTDLSDNGNNGTLVNGVGYSSNNKGTLVFDGTNDYVTLPSSVGYTTEFSQMSWFKSTGAPFGGFHIVFGGAQAEISIPTAGELRIGVDTGTRYVGNIGSGLTDGNWHFVSATYKPSEGVLRGYIDAAAVGTVATNSGNPVTSFTRTMGRFGTSTSYYTNGLISTALIYSRALTAAEIKQNYLATKGRYGL